MELFCPFYKFRLFQVIPDIIFPSGLLGTSYWSTCKWVPFVFLFFTILISGILFMCSNQCVIYYYIVAFHWNSGYIDYLVDRAFEDSKKDILCVRENILYFTPSRPSLKSKHSSTQWTCDQIIINRYK